jgi:hypothetical protein
MEKRRYSVSGVDYIPDDNKQPVKQEAGRRERERNKETTLPTSLDFCFFSSDLI